ncbi:hypothetical protein WIS52_02475 [Pseudonocardia nematodicida]|uniref:Transposase n=1 Tax=Pseudonocardia nematodicida TaxID=1206997 RepID=A0ABV1K4F6_9PSEU
MPSSGPDPDAVAAVLYRVAPEDFVAERDARVAEAREAGDRSAAKAIGAFRRPTRAAWLTNLLVADSPGEVDGLLGLAGPLAEAQRALDGAALRRVSAQRSALVGALVRRAAQLGRDAGHRVDGGLEREVRAILDAALADDELAGRVRSGQLVRAERYSGFGFGTEDDGGDDEGGTGPTEAGAGGRGGPRRAGVTDASGGRGGAGSGEAGRRRDRTAAGPTQDRDRERREQRERALAEAREQLERARLAAADATREHADAREHAEATTEHRTAAHRRVDELRTELDRARDEAAEADRAAKVAERDAAAADRRARTAEADVSRAEQTVANAEQG